MKTVKPIIAPFMALVLALFTAVVPAHATGLNITGSHDDGVGGGNHYFEIYYESTNSGEDCSPYSGSAGYITVWFNGSAKNNGWGWVPSSDVFESYHGVSGFSHQECQVNVYATNGTGQREVSVGWSENGTTQSGGPIYTVTF